MTRRLTIEYVRNEFEREGYLFLNNEYINAQKPINFMCPEGHFHAMTYANFASGSRCIYCYRKENGNRFRLDFDFIKESFAKAGYTLLTKRYKNSNQKLKFVCPVGHKHAINWSNFRNGQRCGACANQKPKTIREIRKSFEDKGYILISNKYISGSGKLKYICPNKHEGEISWNTWNKGSGCRDCSIEKSRNKIEDVREGFEARGYILLSTEYKSANLRLDYLCPNGHQNSMSWSNFRNGSECPDCVIERNKNKFKIPFEKVRESFEKEGYTLLTKKYVNANQKLKFQCNKGHTHSIRWAQWNSGVRCIYCFQENNCGSDNPNWRGGISQNPYCSIWTEKEYKQDLKERDNEKFCWNPQCAGKGSKAYFHHINYVKKDCNPMNVIKICNSCNSIANFNRKWWQAFYKEIMRRRFDNG